MAKQVLLDAQVSIGGTDLTNYVSKVEFEYSYAEQDVTTYGSGGAKEVIGGLEEGSVSLTFKNDYAAAALDSIMAGLVSRTPQTFTVRPNSAVVSSSNPQYSGSILVNSWQPIAGSVGDVAGTDRQYTKSGVFVRATST